MKTSKHDKKDRFFEPFKKKYDRFLLKLDARPSRTATVMAIILFAVLCLYAIDFVNRWKNPSNYNPENQMLIQQIREGFIDTFTVTDQLTEYFLLLEIQKELDAMLRDSTKMDSARVDQLLKLIK